jgi:hypothetical protein
VNLWVPPTARAQRSDQEWFAVIGAIIVKWSAMEKLVATSIHQLEDWHAIAKAGTPIHTDLSAFRFKERKGVLRKLFEQHAEKTELAALDRIYQTLTEPNRVRHALGHDVVAIQYMTGYLGIIKHGNPARGTQAQTTWKTFDELAAVARAIDSSHDALGRLTVAITLRLDAAAKKNPAPPR